MKTIRETSQDSLWNFIQAHLPASLRAEKIMWGYGHKCFVYASSYRRGIVSRFFECEGDPVAEITFDTVELYHPQYFSDFEDLLRRYEQKQDGRSTTLRFWQS